MDAVSRDGEQPFITPQAAGVQLRIVKLSAMEFPVKPKLVHLAGVGLFIAASSAIAQAPPGSLEGPRYGPPPYGYPEPPGIRDPREGKLEVQTFIANSPRAAVLGHGTIGISADAGGSSAVSGDDLFEAAIADQLVHAGYQPNAPGPGQTISYVVSHEVIQPPQPPHSPVSGGVGVGVGNRGSGMGLGIAIDLSKPLGALIATRIEARISDAATHELLWQGRAAVMTRENDKHWRQEAIVSRLTAALFRDFPRPTAR